MAEYEDGEILEEGEEVVDSCPSRHTFLNKSTLSSTVPMDFGSSMQPPGLLLATPRCRNPRKRLHSSLLDAKPAKLTSIYDTRPPLSHCQSTQNHRSSSSGFSERRRDVVSNELLDDRVYAEDLIIKHPRQQPFSNVLLNFSTWMGAARGRKRLDVEDVQKLVLNVLRGSSQSEDGLVSPYLLPYLTPGAPLPTKVCVILLEKMHPSVVQKYRAKLNFFDQCSSVPLMLTKHESTLLRRSEAPLPELLYQFPKPTAETQELSTDELFYAHEVTYLMKHSAGFTDELVFMPTGTFTRQSQPLGGMWALDGDLLHLKWRQRTTNVALASHETRNDPVREDNAYILDVLVSQDGSMHEFRTEPVTDATYAHEVPEHMAPKKQSDKPRSIWLSLVKAIAIDVPRAADGALLLQKNESNSESREIQPSEWTKTNGSSATIDKPWSRNAFEYYLLSLDELNQHGFPVDVEAEQCRLVEATEGGTRDRYVATTARPILSIEDGVAAFDKESRASENAVANPALRGDFVYALDCEMCETDLGMELTRVTVVDIQGAVVYDQLVKPQSTILNYHTEFSGISVDTLRDTKYVLADVQRDLTTRFLFEDTILVGHSLTSDLRALRLVHLTIGDTAILFPHQRGFPYRTSLKYLTKTYLNRDIQKQMQTGHDSAEDAIASLELLLLKVRHGPWFGIPDAVSPSKAFDSMVDQVSALAKAMSMLRLRCLGDVEAGGRQTPRKPWDLYASGDEKARSHSPFCHAHAVKAKAESGSCPLVTNALLKVESCVSWEALKSSLQTSMHAHPSEQPDLCWVEIEPPRASTMLYNDFVGNHELWLAQQQTYCVQVDAFLQQVRDEVLPKDTLLVALPQGDLSLLRYLKGLRTRSKWRDTTPSSNDLAPEELHAAVGDAFRGAMDSCLFLMQKR